MTYAERAHAADSDSPILFAEQDIVDQWVLVPRIHVRTIQAWGRSGEIDEASAVLMCAEILADARLLGRL